MSTSDYQQSDHEPSSCVAHELRPERHYPCYVPLCKKHMACALGEGCPRLEEALRALAMRDRATAVSVGDDKSSVPQAE